MADNEEKNFIRPSRQDIGETVTIKRLKTLIDEKNNSLEKVMREKASFEAENLKLKNEIEQKDLEIKNFQNEKILDKEAYEKMNKVSKDLIHKKDLEIKKLQEELEKSPTYKELDKKLLRDLSRTKINFKEADTSNNINMQELIDTESKLKIKEARLKQVDNEMNILNKKIVAHQSEKIQAQTELDLVKNKIKKSFTAGDMSDYLNTAIESFNREVNTVDSEVNYVINEMDIDLKAQVYMDEQNGMMLSSADIASESADNLSSIKFSIKAIPKL